MIFNLTKIDFKQSKNEIFFKKAFKAKQVNIEAI
jgi:hypothetical protein